MPPPIVSKSRSSSSFISDIVGWEGEGVAKNYNLWQNSKNTAIQHTGKKERKSCYKNAIIFSESERSYVLEDLCCVWLMTKISKCSRFTVFFVCVSMFETPNLIYELPYCENNCAHETAKPAVPFTMKTTTTMMTLSSGIVSHNFGSGSERRASFPSKKWGFCVTSAHYRPPSRRGC